MRDRPELARSGSTLLRVSSATAAAGRWHGRAPEGARMCPRRKSTLVGLRQPTSGSVMLAVEPERVALVPDPPSFEPWLTAREVVALARSLVGLAPRYAVVTLATVAALVVGTLGAWYETIVLLGDLPVGAMLLGMLLTSVDLAFAVAVTAAASFARTPLVIMPLAAGLLILVPLLGLFGALRDWLPSVLLGSLVGLVVGVPAVDYVRPALVALVATGILSWVAATRLQRREL